MDINFITKFSNKAAQVGRLAPEEGYGHYIQSQISGLWYYGKFVIPSVFSRGEHNNHPVEQDANIRSYRYFERLDLNPSDIWQFRDNPINNFNALLRFSWSDPFDFFGIFNTVRYNKRR